MQWYSGTSISITLKVEIEDDVEDENKTARRKISTIESLLTQDNLLSKCIMIVEKMSWNVSNLENKMQAFEPIRMTNVSSLEDMWNKLRIME